MHVALPVRAPAAPPMTLDRSAPPAATATAPLAPSDESAPATRRALVASDADGGLFFKAVFRTFARLTQSSDDGGGIEVTARQKVKIELEIEDDGDVSLQLDIRSKVRVRGLSGEDAMAAASGLMEAMQAFTASLFSALKGLLPTTEAESAPTAAQPARPTPPPQSAPAATVATTLPPSADAASIDTTGDLPVTPAAAALPSPGSPLSRLRLQAAYLSTEMRVGLLVDELRRGDRSASRSDESRGGELAQLRSRFDAVATTLRPDGPPSLTEFLQMLATQDSGSGARLALSLRAAGSFVTAQA